MRQLSARRMLLAGLRRCAEAAVMSDPMICVLFWEAQLAVAGAGAQTPAPSRRRGSDVSEAAGGAVAQPAAADAR
jgi:hypothetical protein